jgi:hypothetical protein
MLAVFLIFAAVASLFVEAVVDYLDEYRDEALGHAGR